ncbi:MAG: hypothetical protein QXE05_10715 [Nitrososphaeria archaeon]
MGLLELNVEVEPETRLKETMISRLQTKYEQDRKGLHVTDLMWPRQYVFRKLEKTCLSEKDVLFYALGSGEGEVLEEIVSEKHEVSIEKYGIIFTPDAIIELEDKIVPVEIKITRQTRGEPIKPHYLLQLASYCMALEVNMGILLIVQLNRTDNPLNVFKIRFNGSELENLKKVLIERKVMVEKALKEGKPEIVSYVLDDTNFNWKCRKYQWRTRCEEIEKTKVR